EKIENHPNIDVIRQEVTQIPEQPAVIASGPLTSSALSKAIRQFTGDEHLYYYDAIAPIVRLDTIDMEIAFRGSRYDRGELEAGDYINCPFTKEEYEAFVDALLEAERIELKSFEKDLERGVKAGAHHFFEGCLPVEIIARRGRNSLAFGPLRPVGLSDPRTGHRPYAVLQLRQDNLVGSLYNLVGFQTNLKFAEQRRVFRMIPGLQNAEFERYGQMHRNTFIFSPAHLDPTLQFRGDNTMLGSLCRYITQADAADFQPMKANFGILPPLDEDKRPKKKRQRAAAYAQRALADLDAFLGALDGE
ncbi:MAG: methylenetetrahydrofolate--tRNA-(uracil(54)-C(5))-methyltransferase (FADH(2)-oxidizing) TrmFO, partial [Anaerolineales bacterium]